MIKRAQILRTSYLIRQLPTCTVFIDKKFEIIHASDKWIKTFCQDIRPIVGFGLFQVFPEVNTKWKTVLEDCFLGKSNPMGVQKYLDSRTGEHWYEWINAPWYDTNENIIGAILHINEVTDVINSELELEKSQKLLSQHSEISKTGMWEYDLKSETVTWCSMTKAIHEVTPDYIPNLDTSIEFYKEGHSRNAISMAMFEATEKGSPWSLKLQIITAKGNEKWVMSSGKPIFKKQELVGFIGTFQDIHNQVLATLESQKNEKLLRTLVDNLPLNVYIKDIESRKILANKSECNYFGLDNEESILGKNNYDLYDEVTARRYTEQDIMVMTSLTPILGEEVVSIKKDGTETTFLTSKIPLIDEHGFSNGLVGISLDISNIKQKERELRHLINVTSQQNKKLIDFAHIVSHNLRSHSANFSMLLDFMVHEKDEDEKQKILTMLTNASSNLLETLDNLNEVVAITTRNDAKKSLVNLNRKIKEVKTDLSNFLIENNTKIINQVSNEISLKVVPTYLESILMNFITNATKYKHPDRNAEIQLSTRKIKDYIILIIEDNGLGIDLNKYGDKLFGMYKTFHSHKNAKGIGLYLVKNQIEAMNGKITVESEVGKGTKFEIYFHDRD
ncbi:PAS domain-containing sensor histidine kinase [Maribacter sp. CXY002]|uniref:PAS domain-containing sensor histidine kinase n=1 Tax=Maribacter luteocoastalis TaxID=3407671 RepID=UPI003B681355